MTIMRQREGVSDCRISAHSRTNWSYVAVMACHPAGPAEAPRLTGATLWVDFTLSGRVPNQAPQIRA